MKKIILYIASSIDGRIAEKDGSVDFLSQYPITEENNYGYNEFIAGIDTIIMGGRTYREMVNTDMVWPYSEQMTYVISHNNWGDKENIRFITENIIETVNNLRQQSGKNIFLAGGAEIATMLLKSGLIDEMHICYVPVIVGEGIPLFDDIPMRSQWKLTENNAYGNGLLLVKYKRL
ncbi:dihydrofolate reductase family protein [Bacteroides sp. 51]|uniref:dihydrofolate reductase family protein n=1 Tax=Bacteroides sp. 51 TaxID=2302938 RepID=UPI0013D64D16|nr:dihydrofolate reductase family protein [Bacteroides sp. 51]NDV81622.1 dihydrofolate reductase [Bacteroides sp. 51]